MPQEPQVLTALDIELKLEPFTQTPALRRIRNQAVAPKGEALEQIAYINQVLNQNLIPSAMQTFQNNLVSDAVNDIIENFMSSWTPNPIKTLLYQLIQSVISTLFTFRDQIQLERNMGMLCHIAARNIAKGPCRTTMTGGDHRTTKKVRSRK